MAAPETAVANRAEVTWVKPEGAQDQCDEIQARDDQADCIEGVCARPPRAQLAIALVFNAIVLNVGLKRLEMSIGNFWVPFKSWDGARVIC